MTDDRRNRMLYPSADEKSILGLSTLAIAQLGDAVFELMVRTKLCLESARTAGSLHRSRVTLVNASAQAEGAGKILPYLSEEETEYYMRGRNAKPGSIPKAASRAQYGAATALETLFGWLYLTGRTERLNELFEVIMDGKE